MIKEVEEELELKDILKLLQDKDVILVEGYKKSKLRKIEVYREGFSDRIITKKEQLIAIASETPLEYGEYLVIDKKNYARLADLVEKEKEFEFEK